MQAAKILIRLGGCPGWSESSLGAHATLLVLSWGSSFMSLFCYCKIKSIQKRLANDRPSLHLPELSKTSSLLSKVQIWYTSCLLAKGLEHCLSSHLSALTLEVIRAPQMTLQQYLSTLPCLPLPSGNLQTPFPSIPWCYLPISSSVFLSFLLLSLSPAKLSSPFQRILRCGHTIGVSIS